MEAVCTTQNLVRSAAKRSGTGVARTLIVTTIGTRRRMTKMENREKITAVIDAFVELAQNNGYEDARKRGDTDDG